MTLRSIAPYVLLGAAGAAILALLRQGSASAGDPTPGASSGLQAGESVLFAGDSLGVGTASRLGALLPQNAFVSVVHGGWTAKDVLSAVTSSGSTGDLAVLSLGSNDAALFDVSSEANVVPALVQLLRDRGARRVLWLVPPSFAIASPPAPATRAKQDAFRSLMTAAGAEAVEPSPEIISALGPDRLHLTPAGYQAFAEEALAALG